MKIPKKLYHGTCRAFIEYALRNGGKFGPENDSISFTPNKEHAKMFAESWRKSSGIKRLEDYFGVGLSEEFLEPVILELDSSFFELSYRKDCEADEFYIEKGPINLCNFNHISCL